MTESKSGVGNTPSLPEHSISNDKIRGILVYSPSIPSETKSSTCTTNSI